MPQFSARRPHGWVVAAAWARVQDSRRGTGRGSATYVMWREIFQGKNQWGIDLNVSFLNHWKMILYYSSLNFKWIWSYQDLVSCECVSRSRERTAMDLLKCTVSSLISFIACLMHDACYIPLNVLRLTSIRPYPEKLLSLCFSVFFWISQIVC